MAPGDSGEEYTHWRMLRRLDLPSGLLTQDRGLTQAGSQSRTGSGQGTTRDQPVHARSARDRRPEHNPADPDSGVSWGSSEVGGQLPDAPMTVRAAPTPPFGVSRLFTTVRLRTVENGEAWLIRRKSIPDLMDGI